MTNPKLQAKIDSTEFRRDVSIDHSSIRQACHRSAEAGKVRGASTVKLVEDLESATLFRVKETSLVGRTIATIRVSWSPAATGSNVAMEVLEYSTARNVVAGFIPAGPRSIPALKSIQRFSEALRLELGR
jgi:hypothetical protein